MTYREKLLAGAVAGTAILWAGMRGLDRYRTAVAANEETARKAAASLDDAKFAVERGKKADQRLREWDRRSLPTDPDVAKSLYQDWVRKQLADAGLQEVQVSDKTFNRRNAHYAEISLEAKGSGTVEQLAAFLYKFYAAPHLHRISGATLTPSDNGAKLAIVLTIDALTLPDASRSGELSKADEQKLPAAEDAFQSSLASRNVFKPFTPGAGNSTDSGAAGAFVTSIWHGADGWQIWVHTEHPNKTRRYQSGDELKYGKFKGKIVDIDKVRVVIETSDGKMEVLLGQNLAEAKPVEKDKDKEKT